MRLVPINSPDDPALEAYVGLTDVARRSKAEPERGIYVAESLKVISRALTAGHRPQSILTEPRHVERLAPVLTDYDIPVYVGQADILEAITGFHVHRGALAIFSRPTLPSISEIIAKARRVVILEDIVDHTNVGAAFRAVAGMGQQAVVVTPRCADPLYRRSIRVSMGAVFAIPWTRGPEWTELANILHAHGFTIAALGLGEDSIDLAEFQHRVPDKLALVLGSEGPGLTSEAIKSSDQVIRIKMHNGVDSLNVASAAAVAAWALGP